MNLKQIKLNRKSQKGATAIEYALLAAMAAVVIAAFVTPIGDALTTTFQAVVTALN